MTPPMPPLDDEDEFERKIAEEFEPEADDQDENDCCSHGVGFDEYCRHCGDPV